MKLKDLLKEKATLDERALEQPISGLCLDSRQVSPGDVFVALGGSRSDGRQYIQQALDAGAVAVLCDQPVALPPEVPTLCLPNLRQWLPTFAQRCYKKVARARLVGVTGTNGKTSIAYLLSHCFEYLTVPCGYIGTLGASFRGRSVKTNLTTPDILSNFRLVESFVDQGARYVALEASSHALEQGRLVGLPIYTGVFTNLTHEHLDYHGSLQAYLLAKKRLFQVPTLRHAVLCANSPEHTDILEILDARIDRLLYGVQQPGADVWAQKVRCLTTQTLAHVHTPWGKGELALPLVGPFHISNALAVISVLCLHGITLEDALAALSTVNSIPGRMEALGVHNSARIFVDFAHTPDALDNALQALRALEFKGRLWCVFGCGGDRDTGKRAVMGEIACRYADNIILTNDNPRSEDPQQIVAHIQDGILQPNKVQVCLDRAKAIRMAITASSPEDVILIAGKGHETTQTIGQEVCAFSDQQVVKAVLKEAYTHEMA